MRDAYDGVNIPERSLEQFIRQYAARVLEAEKTVVGKYGSDAHQMGM
jgi:hypothetical protein